MFKKLLTVSKSSVLMLPRDCYYRQKDGLAMSSPSAPPLAYGWFFQYKKIIQDDVKLFFCIWTI